MKLAPWETPSNKEIERKFLLPELPEFLRLQISDDIDQWYLPSYRIRKIWDEYKITFKEGEWLEKDEFERDITEQEFLVNWEIWKHESLQKIRHYLNIWWHEYEWDVYLWDLKPLCTIEVEFKTKEEALKFVPPSWFWPEITEDKRFSNKNLAKNWLDENMRAIVDRVRELHTWFEPLDTNLDDWVEWIKRWVTNLLEKWNLSRPIFVNVTWWSSSWKTSKVSDIVKKYFEEQWVTVEIYSQDNLYKWPTFMKQMEELWMPLNYDQPEALDMEQYMSSIQTLYKWKDVKIQSYDFKNDPIPENKEIKAAQVIIVEWLFALTDEVFPYSDLRVFVYVSSHWRVIRRLLRDTWENWRTRQDPLEVLQQIIETVEPMDKKYVSPQAKNAHIIIKNDYNPHLEHESIQNNGLQMKYGIIESDSERLQGVLERLWFSLEKCVNERDFYHSHTLKDLESWEVFRIREEGRDVKLTYKYQRDVDNVRKVCVMPEMILDKESREIVEKEYRKTAKIEKTRMIYTRYDWVSVAIDWNVIFTDDSDWQEIKLGDYIEIRVPGSWPDAEFVIKEIASVLSLNEFEWISKSYIDMARKTI